MNDINIQDVKEDKQGLIWVVTGGRGGVDIIDPVSGTVKYLNDLQGLKDTCYRPMMLDNQGRMWIGTDKGAYIADLKMNTITTISTREGLPNNYIVSLNEYNGSVIANTKNKIAVITAPKNPSDKWSIALLKKSEALIKASVTWNSDLITRGGRFLWGDNGVTIIDTIAEEHDSTSTYLTGITVMSQPQYFVNTIDGQESAKGNDSSGIKSSAFANAGYANEKKNLVG